MRYEGNAFALQTAIRPRCSEDQKEMAVPTPVKKVPREAGEGRMSLTVDLNAWNL